MADIDALIKKYFVQPEDTSDPFEPMPATFSGNKITPLIDGTTYFSDLKLRIDALGSGTSTEIDKQFIYIAGWWLHLMGGKVNPAPGSTGASEGASTGLADPFSLDGPGAPFSLISLLKAKARAGVDVRVLGWASYAVMADNFILTSAVQNGGAYVRDINTGTLASIQELRREPTLVGKAWVNILPHTAGAAHSKLVIVGDGSGAIGYTGGMDPVGDRHGIAPHPPSQWHDVQAKVEGPAVQALHDYFRDMWNEIRGREVKTMRIAGVTLDSHQPSYPAVSARTLPTTPVGKHHVQSLRTVPRFRYKVFNMLPENQPIAFAPDGVFEVRSALQNAISNAERYIYMEDQGFWSVDVMKWLRATVVSRPAVKVLLVCGQVDPTDLRYPPYGLVALWQGLLHDLTPAQREQIRMFKRNVIVHTKSTIVDDHWAVIGSANAYRRSLYTDLEHSLAFLDGDDKLVKQYRVDLWSDAFGLVTAADQQKIADVDKALNVWVSTWGTPGSGVTLPATVTPVTLPTTEKTLTAKQQEKYDMYHDVDSRQPWGGCTP